MSADLNRGMDDDWIVALRDRYAVQRELGRGGMAIVYLVRDLRHNRDVALKMLVPDVAATVGRDRFLQEVALTARLQHPHILPVFDSGESAGRIWYTMPYVEGETLRARLDRDQALPVGTALQIATEVASALAYAHAAGVVHRDIKPENLLLSRRGDVMVADFGIAKALDADAGMTETGMSLGTPGYMPLEQLMGERPVRPQADVYALGMILFEMLTGTRPYGTLPPAQMVAALVSAGTPSVATLRRDVPAEIDRLVSDALHAEPANRPATGAEFLARLKSATSAGTAAAAPASGTPTSWTRRRGLVATGLVALTAISVAVLQQPPDTREVSIAVLPFENRGGDTAQAYLSEGVSDELTARLTMNRAFHVAARSAAIRFRGSVDAPDSVARALGVTYLLNGSVLRRGDSLKVTGELVDGAARREAWSRVYVGGVGTLAAIVDSMAADVSDALLSRTGGVRATDTPETVGGNGATGTGTTRDSLAYRYYLLAKHNWNTFTAPALLRALAYSDSAIARDPTFLNAWIVRMDSFLAMSTDNGTMTGRTVLPLLRATIDTVLALAPNTRQARVARGMTYAYFEWDFDAAVREYQMAFRAGGMTANEYIRAAFFQSVLGNVDSALALNATARRQEPTNVRAFGGPPAYWGRRYTEVLERSETALQLDPYFPPALQYQVLALSALGRDSAAVAIARRAVSLNPAPTLLLSLIVALAGADSTAAVKAEMAALAARAKAGTVGAGIMFRAYAAIGDRDSAFLWLNRAIDERYYNVAYLNVDPLLDSLRSDPRFEAARARVGLPRPK